MQKLMGDEGGGGGVLVFLYWPQVSVMIRALTLNSFIKLIYLASLIQYWIT